MNNFALKNLVLIGASTGGPGQIEKIITSLPKLHNTTIIIAQHMVQGFMISFASRLKNSSANPIDVVQNNQTLKNGYIYLCEGKTQLKKSGYELLLTYEAASPNSFNPDINTLFNSFLPLCRDVNILSIILTGIGDDGVHACKELSLNGATCITESASSAIVDGMPSRARLLVPNIEVEDMNTIVNKINKFVNNV